MLVALVRHMHVREVEIRSTNPQFYHISEVLLDLVAYGHYGKGCDCTLHLIPRKKRQNTCPLDFGASIYYTFSQLHLFGDS